MAGLKFRLAFLAAAAMAVASCRCDDQVIGLGQTTLKILSPLNNATYGAGQSFTFEATASNAQGIATLALYAGAATTVACTKDAACTPGQVCDLAQQCIAAALKTCTGTRGEPSLSCSVSVPVDTYRSLITLGQLTLTAIARDEKQETAQTSVSIDIKPLTIVFTAPTPTAGSNPPLANVSGTSPVAVAVSTSIPLASVTITSDNGTSLGSWLSNPTGTMFSQPVDWGLTLGGGLHKLTATAKDVDGNVSSAILDVQVGVPTIQFTLPTLTAGTNPAVADVAGSSPVAVIVATAVPLQEIDITYDNGSSLARWLNNPTGTTFQQTIDWTTRPGPGLHHLTATAITTDMETATATLDVMVGVPTIVFTKPTVVPGSTPPVADVAGTSLVAVAVTTPVPLTLSSVVITADNGTPVASWTNNPTGSTFHQSINWEPILGTGPHTLTATGTWSDGETATATLNLSIGSPSIQFTQPSLTPGTSPAVAEVSGVSPVAVEVMTPTGLTVSSVVITSDNGSTIGQWGPNPVGSTFQQLIDWVTAVGTGRHTLTATGTWSDGEMATATLVVQVAAPSIVFTEPMVTAGTSPAVAEVSGTSAVAVAVVNPAGLTLSSVVITSDNGATIASWTPNPAGTMFEENLNWAMVVGAGTHTLTATGVWSDGEMATATLVVEVGVPAIVFTQPGLTAGTTPAVADVSGLSPVAVAVVTPANLTLSSVVIVSDSGATVASWGPNPTGTVFESNIDWVTVVGLGMHTLTATGTWSDGETERAMLVVQVGGPTIQFTAPMITAGTVPPVADVSGSSSVAVAVGTPGGLTLSSVLITSDNGATLGSWTPNPTGSAFSNTIVWATQVGVGTHLLTATGTWSDAETAVATLSVSVAKPPCTTDAQCPAGDRCCTNDGTCNPIVSANGDCDCDHPCPSTQGCFPGICGATPARCYDGCFPGSQSGAGEVPEACPAVGSPAEPAFCYPLPASQVTVQNQGGACVVGDNCSISGQNCGNLPLDRSQPVSAANPAVPYSCVPVAPNLTGCVPAGTLGYGQTNCGQACGVSGDPGGVASNCAVGYLCVSNAGSLSPPACIPQCAKPYDLATDPFPPIAPDCAGGKDYCDETYQPYGAFGQVIYSTGTCCGNTGAPCTVGTECCTGVCRGRGTCE